MTKQVTVRGRLLLFLAGIAVTAAILVWLGYFKTYHYAVVQEGVLCRAGNRTMREFAATCRVARPKTIVDLVSDQEMQREPFRSEPEFCRQKGIILVRLPVSSWPTTQDLQQFLQIVTSKENQPVLVHCAQGMRRTGMMVAAYEESVLHFDEAKAKAAIVHFGHKGESMEDIYRFIDDYDSQNRSLRRPLG